MSDDTTEPPSDDQASAAAPVAPPAAAPPFVDRAHPSRLGLAGGRVALVGAAFVEGVAVRIANETLAVERVDASLLRVAVGPRDGLGPVTLEIENPDGASTRFGIEIVQGPRIDRLSPAEGPRTGATQVTIEGDGFERGAAIAFFHEHAPAVTFDGRTRLVFTTPPRADEGTGDLVVTNPDGTSFRAPAAFTYRDAEPPRVDAVEPPRAWVSGGARLLVRGARFAPGCVVRLGDVAATTTFESAERVFAIAPARAAVGPAVVAVTNPDGTVGARDDVFAYDKVPAPPKLVQVSPDRGPTSGGQTLVLSGDNFDASTIVRIGEVSVPSRLLGPTRLEIVTPAREAPGPVAIDLVAGGVTVRRDDVYVYETVPPPAITSVAPQRGGIAGGTELSIDGRAFRAGCVVTVGGRPCKRVKLVDATSIEVLTPPGDHGQMVDVVVKNPDGKQAVAKRAFQYDERYR